MGAVIILRRICYRLPKKLKLRVMENKIAEKQE